MMHGLRPNNIAPLASSMEEAYPFRGKSHPSYSPRRLLRRAPTQQGYGTDPLHTFHDDL